MKRIVFLLLFLLCCSCGVVPKSSWSFERPIYTVYEVAAPDSLTAELLAAYPMKISAFSCVLKQKR